MNKRASGILIHLTSLPSSFGVGDLGPRAYGMADFLEEAGQSVWQILPLSPPNPDYDNNPYHSISAFAFNPLLISCERLRDRGWLSHSDWDGALNFDERRVEYARVINLKTKLLHQAFSAFQTQEDKDAFKDFCGRQQHWLEEYVLFVALKNRFGGKPWDQWPDEIRFREPGALDRAREELASKMEQERFFQYVFHEQWMDLKNYCNQKGIELFGDIPIYMHFDSVDVWAHPELYKLDGDRKPLAIAGVPPDYFSETGQLWGHPVYDWEAHQQQGFDWWIRRMGAGFELFDLLRIDHFRGIEAYWETPAHEETAMNGQWIKGPGAALLSRMKQRFPQLRVVAEDLGLITAEVRELMDQFDLPGMKPLVFAFAGEISKNPYIPHNHVENSVVYTGTHDNNPVRAWFEDEASEVEKEQLFKYLGQELSAEDVSWRLIRLAMGSVAFLAIFPMQDILGLGQDHRMNKPATTKGNWRWRLKEDEITPQLAHKLREITALFNRC